MDEKKSGGLGGMKGKIFLPILILIFVLIAFFNQRGDGSSKELQLKENTKATIALEQASTLPLEMFMTATDYEQGILTVKISNQSGYEMAYDMDFELAVEQGTIWNEMEPKTEKIPAEGGVLKDLEEIEVQFDLTPYGPLKTGHYRLICGDMFTDFTLIK